jgi:mRNA interferase MazF
MEYPKMKQKNLNQVLRGQMYFADLNPVIGSEQGGIRPILVVQNDVGNRHSPTIIVAPITTQVKKTWLPTHIGIPPSFGLPHQSMVMLEQVRTIDRSRFGEYLGYLDNDVMDYIDEALAISIGLSDLLGQGRPVHHETPHQGKSDPDELVLTLCGSCRQRFINSPAHIVRRADPTQKKETCMYCNVRTGYDYRIMRRHPKGGSF